MPFSHRVWWIVTVLCGVVSGSAVPGCSSFQCQWRQLGEQKSSGDPVLGCWEGRWDSDANGHGGTLRCIVTRQSDGGYDAWFRARFMKVLAGEYHADLVVTRQGVQGVGFVSISAEADLGSLAGGVYRQEGEIRDGLYQTRYISKHDEGTMTMRRPASRRDR